MALINVFDSLDYLEPKCPGCDSIIDYGTNTKYDEKIKSHVCTKCKTQIK